MRARKRRLALGALLAIASAGCSHADKAPLEPAQPTFEQGVEHMPGPASVWLTSEPATPRVPVSVRMTSPSDPGLQFAHTFVPGATLRGAFATSQGDYRLTALGDACTVDLPLGPSQIADVVLVLNGAGCELIVRRFGHMEDPAMQHDEPAVLITNGGANETPFIEPRP